MSFKKGPVVVSFYEKIKSVVWADLHQLGNRDFINFFQFSIYHKVARSTIRFWKVLAKAVSVHKHQISPTYLF